MNKNQLNLNQHHEDIITIHTALQEREKEEIYRFRFSVFCEELSKQPPLKGQKRRQLSDNLDNQSILLYAKDGENIVGTLRITVGTANCFPTWLSNIFSLQKVQTLLEPHQKIAILTKLAIAPAYRGTTLMYQFLIELLRISYDQNIKYAFGGCNPHLILLYERLGFRRFSKNNFTDPGYGLLIPIVLILDDLEHFKTVRSPAFRFIKTQIVQESSSKKFHNMFPFTSRIINSRLTKRDELWDYVISKLPFLDKAYLFQNMDIMERFSLIQTSAIFHCNKGDGIINRGDISNELYLLLSGTLKNDTALISPGQCFGSHLFAPCLQKSQVIAVSKSEILVIPAQSFEKFKQTHHMAANIFLNNCQDLFANSAKLDYLKAPDMEESI